VEEKVEVKAIRPTAWVLTIALWIAFMFWGLWSGVYFIIRYHGIHWNYNVIIIATMTTLILSAINYGLHTNRKLLPQELGIIYAILATTAGFSSVYPYYQLFWGGGMGARLNEYLSKVYPGESLVPVFFGPTDVNALKAMQFGGQPVPWDAWMPMIATLIIFYSLLWLSFAFMAAILRRQWIEVEEMAFPHATLQLALIDAGQTTKDSPRRNFAKIAMIGALIGFAFHAIDYPHILNPAIPGLPWWSNYWVKWSVQLEGYFPGLRDTSPGTVWIVTFGPLWAQTYWFLWPLEILFSTVLFWVIFFMILPPIEVSAGLIAIPPGSTSRTMESIVGAGWEWFSPHYVAVFAGVWLAIFTVALQWKYIRGTLKELRLYWIGLVLSAILLVAFVLFLGSDPLPAFLLVFWAIVLQLGAMRVWAESGIWMFKYAPAGFAYHALGNPWPPTMTLETMTKGYWVPFNLFNTFIYSPIGASHHATGGLTTLDAFKVLSGTKVDPKKGFLAMAAFTIATIIIAPFIMLPLMYSYGGEKTTGLSYFWRPAVTAGNYVRSADPLGASKPGPPWTSFLISGVITAILFFARLRFPGFPIHPVGLVLGASQAAVNIEMMWLWPLIAKFLVLKVGGVKLYSEKAMPFAAGFTAGSVLEWAIASGILMPMVGGGFWHWGPK